MPAAHWDEFPDELEDNDELGDNEYPDIDEDEETTIPCPECGAEVFDDAEQCPTCGCYLTYDTRVWSGKSLWWIALALLGIIAVILVLAFGY